MQLQAKRWKLMPPAPASQMARLPHIAQLIVQVLYNRGVVEPEDVDAFLKGESRLDNPFRLKDMSEAVTRIRRALRDGERMAVYGDFDADGVTATALLMQALQALGGDAHPYIPHRVDEGYGLNSRALRELARKGFSLVITVDCGIRAIEEVAYARGLGLDVIVTDHHTMGPDLPPALAAINPKRPDCPYPFKGLAGVGLAYKLAQALLRADEQVPLHPESPPALAEDELLDLVALGTVADLAPLLGENRSLVRRGLARLNQAQRPGLQALMKQASVAAGQVTATTIGFVLGPRLNAAGRLDNAMVSYDLLRTGDAKQAEQLAAKLDRLNAQRQQLTAAAVEQARAQIDAGGDDGLLHMVASEHIPSGIVGLVAGRLVEHYYRPALVVELGERQSRGSARSIPEFDITAALDRCADRGLLVRHGGHAAAAGFTVETARLPELKAHLQEIAAGQLRPEDLRPSVAIDAEVALGDLDWATFELLQLLEPTGHGNPQPVLMSRGLRVREARQVGSDGGHLKLRVSDPGAGPWQETAWDAIAFRQGYWLEQLPESVDLAYMLERNVWNGQLRRQLNVVDIRPTAQGAG